MTRSSNARGADRTRASAKKRKRKPGPGWIPNYHGAWAMITVPVLIGVVKSGFVWEHLLLLGLWWIGYFAFFATSLWLRSGRKARYLPPVRTYWLAMLPFALGVLVTAPHLVKWLPVFAPLVAVAAWASANRQDRSMINNVATILAACLMLPVAYDMGVGGATSTANGGPGGLDGVVNAVSGGDWPEIWLVTGVVAWYFVGTALYVKTNIRERGMRRWYVASVVFHAVGATAVVGLASCGAVTWWLAALCLVILLRAIFVPLYGHNNGWLPAKVIGMGEVVASVALFVVVI
ncbi:YwiC-like family protein [Trueperella bialowiezensis]|uniref:YwiC-like protein n=1 Tax=Trueperella bialowiezensis TaxID=312285 RepID=A0A3S4YYA1_9ACTO|nr:YwiC-like family protein [Trueperella bialowiezensis]VEI13488.1 Uncharacterised protein [Trueperella bialowiezensis]